MAIRLIGIDVDGTLINTAKELTAETCAALREAAESGVEIALATGRSLSECRQLLRRLPMIRYVVSCTGARVVDLRENRIISHACLTAEQMRHICRKMEGLDVMLQIFDDRDGEIHNDARKLAEAERYCDAGLAKFMQGNHVAEPDFPRYLREFPGTTDKIHMLFGSVAEKMEAVGRVADAPFSRMESMENDLELMPAGVDKGVGLRHLAEHLGLRPEEVMALGDSGNDIGMLRYAGLAVAMANGSEEAKAAADRIAPDNDHDGAAAAVRQILREQGVPVSL